MLYQICEEDKMDLRDQRIDYNKFHLTEAQAGTNPYDLFKTWFSDAAEVEAEVNIMMLGTSHNNHPQMRVVLLKEVIDEDFVFYTNYDSDKGQAIESNPNVSLLFFWGQHQRQVRIEGIASKVPAETSDEYFASRPRESQIGAHASAQSSVIDGRQVLEDRVRQLEPQYASQDIPRPASWGGYAVKPVSFEFWQGRSSRLHDRIRFRLDNGNWVRERLSP